MTILVEVIGFIVDSFTAMTVDAGETTLIDLRELLAVVYQNGVRKFSCISDDVLSRCVARLVLYQEMFIDKLSYLLEAVM